MGYTDNPPMIAEGGGGISVYCLQAHRTKISAKSLANAVARNMLPKQKKKKAGAPWSKTHQVTSFMSSMSYEL